ncbi:MAG: hypothetical protein PHQ72_14060 [Hespellia sp.]|nr:hypothetical protein [Hespellia sp.]
MQWKKKVITLITGLALVLSMLSPIPLKAAAAPVSVQTEGNEVVTFGEKETKDMVLTVKNNTGKELTNVVITPALKANADGWPFEITKQDYSQSIEKMDADAAQNLTFSFTARGDITKNYYKLKFNVSYTEDGKDNQAEQMVYVKTTPKQTDNTQTPTQPDKGNGDSGSGNSDNGDSGNSTDMLSGGDVSNGEVRSSGGGDGSTDAAGVPRVIVTGFATDPAQVKAGTNFKLVIHVMNTSKTTAVSNMLFDLQAPSSGTETAAEAPAFLPISGSSSIYLDRIGCGETKDISIDMNARADLVQKPYSVDMAMKYEDSSHTQFESSSSLAVPVQQPPRFEFSKMELSPESIAVGEDTNLSCSLYNTGRIKLYNVKVKFTGASIEENEIFVGNVDSGGTGAIDAMLTGKEAAEGDGKCKMTVSYEDEAGTVSKMDQEFSLEVTPMMEDMAAPTVMDETQSSFPIVPVVLVIILIIVAAVVTVIVIRKKKKKIVEEEDLLDELDGPSEDE